jgi:enoyl-CoA hydratase/carnithine racemase
LCHDRYLGLSDLHLYQNAQACVDIDARLTGGTMRASGFETLSVESANRIAVVTMNRPEVRNALNRQAYVELETVFREVQSDDSVSVVVLTGADPAFCSGEDVKQMMTGPQRDQSLARLTAPRPRLTPAAAAIHDCDRPIIAAVNGAAVGWGMELSLLADIRVASDQARFGEIFIKRGLVSDAPGMMILPRLVGPERASTLLFTGDIIDAGTALSWGLVSRVVPHAELMPETMALAARIAGNPPLALRSMKEGLRRGGGQDLNAFGEWVSGTLGRLFQTEDHREGVASFLERRAPRFTGR